VAAFAEESINGVAATDMQAGATKVAQEPRVLTTSLLKGVRKYDEPGIVEFPARKEAVFVSDLGELPDYAVQLEPCRVERRERLIWSKDVAEKDRMNSITGLHACTHESKSRSIKNVNYFTHVHIACIHS
jgi:hypothetical protein